MPPNKIAPIEIALAFDSHAFRGASITVQSVINSTPESTALRFHLFTKNLAQTQTAFLQQFSRNHPGVSMVGHTIDDSMFSDCKSLHGNFMTYARILLPDLISTERLLYLDSDLLITEDLSLLWQTDLQNQPIGAVSLTSLQWSNDNTFLNSLGIPLDAPYFNAGVLLIDSSRWRAERTGEKLKELAKIHGLNLPSVDQTLLNLAYHEKFVNLEPKWNQLVYAGRPMKPVVPGILHFLGSPKPWDFWSMRLHMAQPLFDRIVRETKIQIPNLTLGEILRSPIKVFRSSRSLLRVAKSRFQNR